MTERRCEFCGGSIPPTRRADAMFCKDAHKQAFYRRNHDPKIGSPERKRRQRAGQLRGLSKKYAYRRCGQEMRALNDLKADRLQRDGWPWLKGRWVTALQSLVERYYVAESGVIDEAFAEISGRRRDTDPALLSWSPSDTFPRHECYLGFRDSANPPAGWHAGQYWPRPEGAADRTALGSVFSNSTERKIAYAAIEYTLDATHGHPTGQPEDYLETRPPLPRTTWNIGSTVPVPPEPRREIRIIDRSQWWNRLYRALPKAPNSFPCLWCGETVKVASAINHDCDGPRQIGFDLKLAVTETYFCEDEKVVSLFPDQSQPTTQKGDDECAA